MPTSYTGRDDEDTPDKEQAGLDQRKAAAPAAPQQTNYQKTYQQPQTPQAQPGQQTPMPWASQMPGLNFQGQSATPWSQQVSAPAAMAAPGGSGQAMGGNEHAMPNWEALAQRFGGGGAQGAAPAFNPLARLQALQQGGPMAGGNPWLQALLQKIGAAIAARRGMGGPQGGPPGGMPIGRPGQFGGSM